jgi:hypothetical protein
VVIEEGGYFEANPTMILSAATHGIDFAIDVFVAMELMLFPSKVFSGG